MFGGEVEEHLRHLLSSIVIFLRAIVGLCSTLNSVYVYFTEFIEDTRSLGMM